MNNLTDKKETSTIISTDHTDLNSFFYKELEVLNQKNPIPLPTGILIYCSDILDKYALSDKLFEAPGQANLPIEQQRFFGVSFLQALQMDSKKKYKCLKDLADTSLVFCGLFHESLNRKGLSAEYYSDLGVRSFQILDNLEPHYFNSKHFFKQIAFHYIVIVQTLARLNIAPKNSDSRHFWHFLSKNSNAS